MIEIKALNKFFNKGKRNEIHVIDDINLTLPEKGMVAIFGKSGCGKTTLLNLIGGLDKFQSGEISIEGNDVRKNTDVIRNKYIGYIFQNYNLTKNETCFDNVADALRLCGLNDEKEIAARVAAALKNVGMEQYAKRTPDTLSGGQQQRIAIARAIVKNPRIILADEPTGNLDEINTVMIMDLLKAISKEHLVILITHEANLVDYYSDTVIELSDGKIVSTKTNGDAEGFAARGKNDLYLGEYERRELSDGNIKLEYYGNPPPSPINLKIVNRSGKIYLKIENEEVQVIDRTSEIKIHEGVYEEKPNNTGVEENLDMSALPTVEGKKFGSLFSFFSSLKNGYRANFQNRKRGTKAISVCMILFSMVTVFMSSLFGTAFRDLSKIDAAYNHNVFYLYTPNESVSSKLNEAVGNPEAAIDSLRIMGSYPLCDGEIAFMAGSFETFTLLDFGSVFRTNAVLLDSALAEKLPLLEGKKEALASNEIIISSRVADSLLEKSTLGYIEERRDLLGLLSPTAFVGGAPLRIAGIVDSDETAVYLPRLSLAKYTNSSLYASNTDLASNYGIALKRGEAVLEIPKDSIATEYPSLNESIKIQGNSFKIIQIRESEERYRPVYLVSDEDYIALSKSMGETHPSATDYGYYTDGYIPYDYEYSSEYKELYYTVIHSSSPEKTKAWLENNFSELTPPSDYQPSLVSPSDVYGEITKEGTGSIAANLITIAVTVVITCLCMYFIMHASLMNRIKEIGIYRAIGVSKRNLIFRFTVESALILTLTVVIGYLISSFFILTCINGSSLMAEIFYYPAWLAISVLILISAVTLFFGILPIMLLLRKTPSEILSKYDI